MIKVSVIIPMYNAEDTIENTIKSIPKRDDVEIIVIDDGSTDKSAMKVAGTMISRAGQPRQLFSKKNGGVATAINKGLELAEGEYVVFLGSDDDFYTDEFEKAMLELDGTDLVYFNLKINSGEVWEVNKDTKGNLCGSVKFMRREFIGDTRENEMMKTGEDYYFYLDLLAKKPTEKYTGLTVKHYNFPREGSLSWKRRVGEL